MARRLGWREEILRSLALTCVGFAGVAGLCKFSDTGYKRDIIEDYPIPLTLVRYDLDRNGRLDRGREVMELVKSELGLGSEDPLKTASETNIHSFDLDKDGKISNFERVVLASYLGQRSIEGAKIPTTHQMDRVIGWFNDNF